MNTAWCVQASEGVCADNGHAVEWLGKRPFRRDTESDASRDLLATLLPPSVWPINPFRLNERLTVQKGLFLAPGDPHSTFAENLAALPGHERESNVACFVIPRGEIHGLGKELYDTNVTEATLFEIETEKERARMPRRMR